MGTTKQMRGMSKNKKGNDLRFASQKKENRILANQAKEVSTEGATNAARRANLDIEIATIHMCWQNGLTLSESYKRMNSRYKFTDKKKLIDEWRKLKRVFGCASLPFFRG